MNGLPPTDTQVRLAGTILSSGSALAALLNQAGYLVSSTAITPSRPAVLVAARINLNLNDSGAAAEAAEAHDKALSGGSHTAAVSGVLAGAVVTAAGAPFVQPVAGGDATLFVEAASVQTCSAVGLTCFPGVQCQLPSIVGAAGGEPIRCGACPSGFYGDGTDCLDTDECLDPTTTCFGACINTVR